MTRDRLRSLANGATITSDDRAHEAMEIAINIVGNIRSRNENDDGFELTGEQAAERVLDVMRFVQAENDLIRELLIEFLDLSPCR